MKHADAQPQGHTLDALLREARGLIFDCDGTLVDSLQAYHHAWLAGLAGAGIHLEPAWHAARCGLSETLLLDAVEREHGVMLEREAVVAAMRRHYLANLATPKSHLRELTPITAIARRFAGVKPLAVASSGSREIVTASLSALGLAALFDTIVSYDDVGQAKPHPAIHLEAARRLGLPAAHCLVFEDSAQGLEAARRGGFPVIDVADCAGVR